MPQDTLSLTLYAIAGTLLVLMIAPRVLARNKGVALRNIALWIGIFLVLAVAYKVVGPGRQEAPLAAAPSSASITETEAPSSSVAPAKDSAPSEEDGFMTVK